MTSLLRPVSQIRVSLSPYSTLGPWIGSEVLLESWLIVVGLMGSLHHSVNLLLGSLTLLLAPGLEVGFYLSLGL